MTRDEIIALPEYKGRHAGDFRVDFETDTWEVYGGGGAWLSTTHVHTAAGEEEEEK